MDWLPLGHAPTGDCIYNLGLRPDWGLNWEAFGLWDDAQSTEPPWPGHCA